MVASHCPIIDDHVREQNQNTYASLMIVPALEPAHSSISQEIFEELRHEIRALRQGLQLEKPAAKKSSTEKTRDTPVENTDWVTAATSQDEEQSQSRQGIIMQSSRLLRRHIDENPREEIPFAQHYKVLK